MLGFLKKKVEHELKYVISNSRYHKVLHFLETTCKPDPEFPAGIVSSIYYDTYHLNFINEKINSDFIKTKIRVRWYSDLNYNKHSDFSFLEVKFKIGSRREKIRETLSIKGNWLSKVNLSFNKDLIMIPDLLKERGFIVNNQLFPLFQISYKRKRFIEPYTNYRICIDYDIHVPRVSKLFFTNSNSFYINKAVFEFKGSLHNIPSSLYPLTDMGCRKSSFSKYSESFKKLVNHI